MLPTNMDTVKRPSPKYLTAEQQIAQLEQFGRQAELQAMAAWATLVSDPTNAALQKAYTKATSEADCMVAAIDAEIAALKSEGAKG